MAIDRKKAVQLLSEIKVMGNADGLIPAFGVLVNFLPSNFWNTFSEKLLKAAGKEHYEEVEIGLEKAAAECGYHTGWGIINSDEFKSIVGPMIQEMPADVLHGAFAVLTAWGWADSEIIELVPNEKMIVRAYHYYELSIRDTFAVTRPAAYMVKGICRAFMDIAYGKPYPDGLGAFKSVQTKGIELGDPYAEFLVTRA